MVLHTGLQYQIMYSIEARLMQSLCFNISKGKSIQLIPDLVEIIISGFIPILQMAIFYKKLYKVMKGLLFIILLQ